LNGCVVSQKRERQIESRQDDFMKSKKSTKPTKDKVELEINMERMGSDY
jgi:hypothetical protein